MQATSGATRPELVAAEAEARRHPHLTNHEKHLIAEGNLTEVLRPRLRRARLKVLLGAVVVGSGLVGLVGLAGAPGIPSRIVLPVVNTTLACVIFALFYSKYRKLRSASSGLDKCNRELVDSLPSEPMQTDGRLAAVADRPKRSVAPRRTGR